MLSSSPGLYPLNARSTHPPIPVVTVTMLAATSCGGQSGSCLRTASSQPDLVGMEEASPEEEAEPQLGQEQSGRPLLQSTMIN